MAKKSRHGLKSPVQGLSGSESLLSGLSIDGGGGGGFGLLAATNTIYGTSGADSLLGTSANDLFVALAGNDTVRGQEGDDTAFGGNGNDDMFGETGSDSLMGDEGNDSLYGGSGDDTLRGGTGNDTFNGGDGQDTLDYSSSGGVNVDLQTGTASDGFGDTDRFSQVEHVIGSPNGDTLTGTTSGSAPNSLFGGSGDDTLFGLAGDDYLDAGSGTDTVIGGLGADSLIGGDGTDTASYNGSSAGVAVSLLTGAAEGGDAEGDALNGIENLVGSSQVDTLIGSSGANSLAGGQGNDTLRGLEGNDVLNGGTGADSLVGDSGTDTADYDGSSAGVTVDLSNAAPGAGGDAQGDVLTGIENVGGSSSGDTLTGSAGVNVLSGNNGNDVLAGLQGGDTLFGGSGTDRADYSASGAGVAIDLSAGVATGGDAAGDTLFSLEDLTGSASVDTLIGNSVANALFGGSGADTLRGNSGNDVLTGGAGADCLLGDAGTDTATYDNSTLGVTVDLSDGGPESGGDAQDDVLTSIENVSGSPQSDRLIGNGSVNLLAGGFGDDFVRGNAGNDSLFGGAGQDTLDYSNSTSGVTVDLADGTARDGFGGTDTISGFEVVFGSSQNDTMFGDTTSDTFVGGTGNDRLEGGQGNDTFSGGEGNDYVRGDQGDDYFFGSPGADTFHDGQDHDVIDYSGSPTAIAITMVSNFTGGGGLSGNEINGYGFGGWAQGDTYIGLNPHNDIIGSDFNDTIGGYDVDVSPYANTFYGGLGDDTLLPGGDGPDTLQPDNSVADSMFGGAGSDWVSWVNQQLNVTVDLAAQTGRHGGDLIVLSSIENAAGSQASDLLYGDAGANSLRGFSGADSLFGGSGADGLFGELGDDFLRFDSADVEIHGGDGVDTAMGQDVRDSVQLDYERFNGTHGYAAIERFYLLNGDDIFNNSSNAADFTQLATNGTTVFGGSGRDSISMRGLGAVSGVDDWVDAGSANDQVWGGFGNDNLFGNNGDDFIYGGKGDDNYFGGQGFDVFYVGVAEGTDHIYDNAAEVNGLVLFWGWDSTFGGNYDGVDPTEIEIAYSGSDITITNLENGGEVHFERSYDSGTDTWSTPVDVLNLWDYGNGDAGNATTVPPTYARDIWSATFDANSGEFTPFTLAVNG